ncbi:transposase-like protein [Gracilibacillus halotolerans]|uniref:Transposase-like protein n=1 Tax=Gracilibacillus halotolerans TaxID=74386 RepID=A0A841RN64_9BACI|nr:hypothetical protein [Gracilibacillus halotolerans]MBB6512394.1 transposase-like protein [Gracilibacillus halotolerans]
MATKKLLMVMFPIFLISFVLLGCSFNKTDFVQVKGDSITYSEYFKTYDGLDARENIKYYKPISIDKVESSLPEPINNAITTFDSNRLPFTIDDEKAYLITSTDEDGNTKNQVQLSYFSRSEYDEVDDFFIVSITEVDENPLVDDILDKYDTVGNAFKKEFLIEDLPIYQQVITTNSALLYKYYDYDETRNSIVTVGTAANEFYTYYNGYIYHVGYLIDKEKNNEEMQERMLHLTRDYILGNSM